MRQLPSMIVLLAATALTNAPAQAQTRAGMREEPSFAHPRDIGPRYEPEVERWWQDYKRTGCMPVPHAVRRPDGRYVVRATRDCGGTPASRSGM
jgi:hypothetical protein